MHQGGWREPARPTKYQHPSRRAGQHLVENGSARAEIVTFSLGTPTSTQVPSGCMSASASSITSASHASTDPIAIDWHVGLQVIGEAKECRRAVRSRDRLRRAVDAILAA